MILTKFIAITGLIAMLSGCVLAVNTNDWEDEAWFSRQNRNAEKIEQLEMGASESSIESDFGDADFVESFTRNGETFRVLYYRTRQMDHDGTTTKDETTPLVFIDGTLIGWGDSAIEHATTN
jgi:hypothetical protein